MLLDGRSSLTVPLTSGSRKTSDKRSNASPLSTKSPEKKKQCRHAKVWGDIALESSDEDDGSSGYEGNVNALLRPNRLFAGACFESSEDVGQTGEGFVLETSATPEPTILVREDASSSETTRRKSTGADDLPMFFLSRRSAVIQKTGCCRILESKN